MMKIMGFIMANKLLTAIIVIAIVAMLYMYSTGTGIEDIIGSDGYEPEGTLSIKITDVATGSSGIHTMDIDDLSPTASLFGTPHTLTAYDQTVWGIEPTSIYTIDFSVFATANMPEGADESAALKGTVYMEGTTPNPIEPPYFPGVMPDTYVNSENQWNVTGAASTTWGVSTEYQVDTFSSLADMDAWVFTGIKGANIDGSVFDITYIVKDVATNGLTYYGVITAQLTIIVDNDGNVAVTIDDVNAGVL